jgi:large subunit ribosomal protein L25
MKTTGQKNEKIELLVSDRSIGKANSRASRVAQKIPAVLYGPKHKPVNLLMDELAVTRYGGRKFESTIFVLKSSDTTLNKMNVLFKKVQNHPVNRRPTHVDLYALDMTATIRVNIALRFEGKPTGLADGGMLQTIMREVEVECLPTDIPDEIVADVTHLGVGDALHVSDLKVAGDVKIVSAETLTVATVAVISEEAATPVAAVADAAAPAAGAAAAAGAKPAAGAKAAAPAAGAKAAPAAAAKK